MLVLLITREERPLKRIGVQKHNSALMCAQRLVRFVSEQDEYLIRKEAFLWAVIRFKIWGEISDESLMTPTCSALLDKGMVAFDKDIGFKNDSIGGICLSLLLTKATSLVLSGTKIVLVLLAY